MCKTAPMRPTAHYALCIVALSLAAGCATDAPGTATQPAAQVPSPGIADVRRGKLLYGLACAECHSVQAHWRDQRLVHDWPSLIFEVTRWQEIAGQKWQREEIDDVAAYLNTEFYRVPCPIPGCLPERIGGARPEAVAPLRAAREAF
jgi:hypothetical protein